MKILIFSWRDIKNPKSGGAEVLTHEMAKRWVKRGHQVSLVSARFPGSKASETTDGIKIFRPAKFFQYSPFSYLLYLIRTAKFYQKNLTGKYDIIVDQVHGLPFFTPFYVKEKVILFPLEVAKEIWRYEIPFPFWPFGWLLEFAYIKLFRNRPFLTISPSTAKDLKNLGVKNVSIVTPGISLQPQPSIPRKSQSPLIVSLSRLTPMKRIEATIRAFKIISNDFPRAKLLLIGQGRKSYLQKLKAEIKKSKLTRKVIFTSFVREKKKQEFLSQAWVLVSTSLHEGWGLNVIEAATCGTPAVVYRVPGLVDAVQDRKTGVICKVNTPEELAKEVARILTNASLRKKFSQNALEYSRQFDWEKSAKEGLAVLKKIVA